MAREQIRVRVDGELWESLKCEGESNTELCDRILSDWQEQKAVLSVLATIDPLPSQALGRLLLSYELLQQASVTIQQPNPSPVINTAPAPTIGGLENNSDDW